MERTLKVKDETLQLAGEKLKKDLPKGAFILKRNEHNALHSHTTGCYGGESVEHAIEKAKKDLPDSFMLKGDVAYEIEKGTNIYIPVNVQAKDEWTAEQRVKSYIEDKYFYNKGFEAKKASYKIHDIQLLKKGFKGVFGVGKTENTYLVKVYIIAWVTIKYNTWAVVEADITDEIDIANSTFINYAKNKIYSEVDSLVAQGVDINYFDENGRNALFYVCDNYKISKMLLNKGIDFRKTDNLGDNILTFCLKNNNRIDYQIRVFLENHGLREDKVLIEKIAQKNQLERKEQLEIEKMQRKEWEQKESEKKRRRYCLNCKTIVETWDASYSYDDGWFTHIMIKCTNCNEVLYETTEQN
jgi:hypothetical protein